MKSAQAEVFLEGITENRTTAHYSFQMASTGFTFDALTAGYNPARIVAKKMIPAGITKNGSKHIYNITE